MAGAHLAIHVMNSSNCWLSLHCLKALNNACPRQKSVAVDRTSVIQCLNLTRLAKYLHNIPKQ